MPPPDRVGAVFAALSDPTRRQVMQALADAGPATATSLAGTFPISRQAVAKHLNARSRTPGWSAPGAPGASSASS